MRSNSPHDESSYRSANINSYFPPDDIAEEDENEDDLPTPHPSISRVTELRDEPTSDMPSSLPERLPVRSPAASALTTMLQNTPSSTSHSSSYAGSEATDSDTEEGDEENQLVRQRSRKSQQSNGHSEVSEETPLLRRHSDATSGHVKPNYLQGEHDLEGDLERSSAWPRFGRVISRPFRRGKRAVRALGHPSRWDKRKIWQKTVAEPAGYLPAVVLGALLNVLDALSYGMILFPLGEPLFEKLGPAGISMFYVSCIVSQLTFSFGGSIFKGGVGSEMIEVVPFFHKMAFTILATVGEENPKAVISTTITSYAISSVITGFVFFLMGICRFGYIVGFIPRHILIGCIGGVGWFLIATGLEVTARLDGNLEYNLTTLHKLFEKSTILLWVIPLVLGVFLYRSSKVFTGKYYLPSFILMIPAVFYFFVLSLPQLEVPSLREKGWVFAAPDADEPWWYFYTLYGKCSYPSQNMKIKPVMGAYSLHV